MDYNIGTPSLYTLSSTETGHTALVFQLRGCDRERLHQEIDKEDVALLNQIVPVLRSEDRSRFVNRYMRMRGTTERLVRAAMYEERWQKRIIDLAMREQPSDTKAAVLNQLAPGDYQVMATRAVCGVHPAPYVTPPDDPPEPMDGPTFDEGQPHVPPSTPCKQNDAGEQKQG